MRFAMPVLTTSVVLLMGLRVAWGQGTVTFNNRNTAAGVDARVTFLDGTGVGAGFTAQLYGGPVGTSIDQLTPLFPVTTFRTIPALALGYVFGEDVRVPGVPGHQRAVLLMRVFNSSTWENSACRGESNPITVVLAIGDTDPPTNLVGLRPFTVDCIPEPATLALLGLAAGSWCLIRWLKRAQRFYDLDNVWSPALQCRLHPGARHAGAF